MEERLLKLLDTEQLSSSKFADVIGVQRSSVSHILSGRNKPSFDFLLKTLKAFPLLNADWLILEEGDMYEDMKNYVSGGLFDQTGSNAKDLGSATENISSGSTEKVSDLTSNAANIPENPVLKAVSVRSEALRTEDETSLKARKIRKVILLYDDNTFHTYEPGSE